MILRAAVADGPFTLAAPQDTYISRREALVIGLVYTLPNFFGEAPAVQVSSGKSIVKVDSTTLARVEQALSRVGALDLFLRRPGGLQAPVDERGANFSAGERQLLAFARAELAAAEQLPSAHPLPGRA